MNDRTTGPMAVEKCSVHELGQENRFQQQQLKISQTIF